MASTAGRMKIGVMQSSMSNGQPHFNETKQLALAIEKAGLDSFWIADHLLYRFPDRPESGIWEVFTVLGGIAAITERIQFGPLVACTGFRNPAMLAKIADTLDEMSGGRFILGLGAGWHEPEYQAFGYPFDHRASRFDEALQIITPLLHEGRVDFHGTYSEAADCTLIPRGPSPSGPPIWVGGKGPRMLRLTAQYADGWNTAWHLDPAVVVERWAGVEAACREVGRDPATLELTAGTNVRVLGPGESAGEGDDKRITGTPEEVATKLRGFAEIGVRHLIVILESNEPDAIARFGSAAALV